MKILALLLLTLPFANAQAASVTIEISDEVTYDNIRTYSDGLTIVQGPKLYGYPVASGGVADQKTNGHVFCSKIGMTFKLAKDKTEPVLVDVVTYYNPGEQGPQFTKSRWVITEIMCNR